MCGSCLESWLKPTGEGEVFETVKEMKTGYLIIIIIIVITQL